MSTKNHMRIEFDSKSENESFIRTVIAAFLIGVNPTMEELSDIKTAVSEAVTNCIIHGYEGKEGIIVVEASLIENELTITIQDFGVGITDIGQAMEPLYTSKPEMERSGMGFSFMEAFMDHVYVTSTPGEGTMIKMKKEIGRHAR
ncbi:MAG: anti-sigma F factor [Firmicutes bacterium]|uniref:Anti-sigma F factor n=1 Tax=Candidatus Scybalomonas excrementavium TaxID=2840943 RepID=A0A9D9HYK2_9FIRM|nr:anti-sigma F factor [Candidatus Scybalomonas excrementavium]